MQHVQKVTDIHKRNYRFIKKLQGKKQYLSLTIDTSSYEKICCWHSNMCYHISMHITFLIPIEEDSQVKQNVFYPQFVMPIWFTFWREKDTAVIALKRNSTSHEYGSKSTCTSLNLLCIYMNPWKWYFYIFPSHKFHNSLAYQKNK